MAWKIEKSYVQGNASIVEKTITVNSLGGAKGDKGDTGAKGDKGNTPQAEWDGTSLGFDGGVKVDLKGNAPTDEELNALIDVAIVPYVTSMDDAIDIINGQIV